MSRNGGFPEFTANRVPKVNLRTNLGQERRPSQLLTNTYKTSYPALLLSTSWRKACTTSRGWCVSDDGSRRETSEGEGACSPLFKVRSHLPLRGKLGWMTPRVGVKTTLTNGSAPLGALVPKQGPRFFAHGPSRTVISGCPELTSRCAIGGAASSPSWSPQYSIDATRG